MSLSLPPPLSECTFDACLIASSPYRYRPSAVASGVFVTIFWSSLVGCLVVAVAISRGRWLSFTVLVSVACVLEVVGYAARLGSWGDPWDVRLFAVSTSFLTVAPAFVSVGIYTIIFQRVVPAVLSKEHSRLIDPAHYTKLLFTDLLGFALQLIGFIVGLSGASPSTGVSPHAPTGSGLVAAGLAAQLLSLSAFSVLFAAVLARASLGPAPLLRTRTRRSSGWWYGGSRPGAGAGGHVSALPPGPRFKAFVAVTAISLVCLLARNLYAVIAIAAADGLGLGGGGAVASDEALFIGFDGIMMAQAVVGVVAVHPARFLDERRPKTETHGLRRWHSRRYGAGSHHHRSRNSGGSGSGTHLLMETEGGRKYQRVVSWLDHTSTVR